ncbi:exocyst complex component 3-like protein 4 isoform X2 [Toxotes jaculatrix]|uniref:exocyst complex component 3-like protein 4 isoform X2 n=1 Tax=Toxotes jaculatrix TaxID=941984 RepID=UPI001B3AC5CC|nr:exocyst complex component 3-like protein 4 isoform X2 [Toxotes jaculatrix]
MSEMMDKSMETPDEDKESHKSNGTTLNDGVKEVLGVVRSVRKSLRHAAEKSPLSLGGKGSKVTPKAAADGNESELQPPPSPTTSPLRRIGSLFQKKDEDTPKASKLRRSKTAPNKISDTLLKRSEFLLRSLSIKTKKDQSCRQEPYLTVSEASMEEKNEEEEEEEEVEGIEEMYTLPDIPQTPLSVMQISKLIEMEVLEEAHLNLLSLRQEFQREQEQCGEDSPMELVKKEKDLSLLYRDLRNKISTIVRDSSSLPARNKGLLVHVARIIQEEEMRAQEPGGLPDSWMEAWRDAVGEGVQAKVANVHLEQREQNVSWLAVHLGLLGKAIVEDLENVKRELQRSYPRSFKVFSTYVKSYHRVVGQHLKKLELQVAELKDLYALLDWIFNRYKSERIMGSLSLQPDMKDESTDLQLEDNFLKQLKEKYCSKVKVDMNSSLDRIIELENEEFWMESKTPNKEENFPNSPFHMDIWTKVKATVVHSGKIDAHLEQRVISSCLQELKQFPKRFETEFKHHCHDKPQPLWTEYQITYINSFTALQEHMDGYRDACPDEVEGFRKEVKWLITRLLQGLEDQYKEDVKPYLKRMITRKWLTNDEDFNQLYSRTTLLSHHCALMRRPHVQEFASRLHYHVVREYIGQLMRSNFSCKNRKHEKAANKIHQQWRKLVDLFTEMESTHEWLHPVGDDLSDIIGQKNKTDIKDHLEPLVEHYADFSRKHLVAVLNFRGLTRGREHQLILQRFTELKKKQGDTGGDKSHVLFGDMQVTVNTNCLSSLPFSCLSFLLPDN